jgi:uncharacterized Tic20 family protein
MIEQATSDTISPTSDERMMGALAHFFGIVGSLIVYLTQKDRSRFVRFQAAQALAFDLIVMLAMFVVFFCLFSVMFIGIFGTMFAGLNSAGQSENFSWFMMLPTIFPFGMFICIFPFSLAILITRIVATVSVFSGKDFRYPVLGTRVEQFLND